MARKTTSTSGRKSPGTARGAKPTATRARQPGAAARKAAPARKTVAPKTAPPKTTVSKTGPAKAASRTGASARSKPATARIGRPAAVVARQPVQSKQELRDRIEKLERANVVLRAKNREAVEASREAANRIDQLQEQLSRHEAARPVPSDAEAPVAGTTADISAETPPGKSSRRGRKTKQKAEPIQDEAAAEVATDAADDED